MPDGMVRLSRSTAIKEPNHWLRPTTSTAGTQRESGTDDTSFHGLDRYGERQSPTIGSGATRWAVPGASPTLELTAFFTSWPIRASSAAVSSVTAKAVGHMVPSSRVAESLKPTVAYRALNFAAGWKKQTILPSLA